KKPKNQIVPSGGAAAGRIGRPAAASTNAFSITLTATPRWWSCAASIWSARRTVPIVPGVLRYASRTWRMYSFWLCPSSTMRLLNFGRAQRRPVNVHRVAVVPQTALQRFHHRTIAQRVGPLVVHEIGCNAGGMLAVTLLHQLKEDVGLLRFQIQVPKFVDQKDVEAGQTLEQLPRGPIRQRGIHFVEQILRADELAAIAILQRLQQQAATQPAFAPSGFSDQDDIFRLGDELQLRKNANLFAVHARLAGKRERLQRPALGQIGAPDTPLQRALLPGLKLRAHQARHELRVADVVLIGGAQLFVVDLQDAPQLEILQQF